jgi:hypothetical protein
MAQNINPNELQDALGGVDFPASKEELIQRAKDNAARQEIVVFLEMIGEGIYDNPTDVSAELVKTEEGLNTGQAARDDDRLVP